jgi:hypothetical protein
MLFVSSKRIVTVQGVEDFFSSNAMTLAALGGLVDQSTLIQVNGESSRRKRAHRADRPGSG